MIFEELKYIYNGTANYEKDKSFFIDNLNGELIWEFSRFGTKVCAFKLDNVNHQILIAAHLKSDVQIQIFRTENLANAIKLLRENGLGFTSGTFGIPDGNCIQFQDYSGKEYGIYEKNKPDNFLRNEYLRQQNEQK